MPLYVFRNDEALPCKTCGAVLPHYTTGHGMHGSPEDEHLPVACADRRMLPGTPEEAPSGLQVMVLHVYAPGREVEFQPGRAP